MKRHFHTTSEINKRSFFAAGCCCLLVTIFFVESDGEEIAELAVTTGREQHFESLWGIL